MLSLRWVLTSHFVGESGKLATHGSPHEWALMSQRLNSDWIRGCTTQGPHGHIWTVRKMVSDGKASTFAPKSRRS